MSQLLISRRSMAVLVAAGAATAVHAQHAGDVILDIEDGAIVSNAIEAGQPGSTPEVVFSGEFGDSGFPTFTANPGFDCLPGTFDPDSSLGFTVLEPLQVWSGDGFEPAGGELLTISFLTLEVAVGDEPVEGFTLAVQPNGGFHRHYNMILDGDGGLDPDPGVYLLVRSLWSTDPGLAPSAPIHVLLGYEVDDAEVEAAAAWLSESLEGSCPADLDGNGIVDGADLGAMLAAWGTDDAGADLDGNGVVDGADLGAVLASWGEVCP